MNSAGNILQIKNIIFDFGGVIINISHQRVEKAFSDLGLENFQEMFNQATQSDLFRIFEKGEIGPDEFRNRIRNITGLTATDADLNHAWNQIIGSYPAQRIELLKNIKDKYRIFLLSNTNIIHFDFYIPKFELEFGFPLQSLFEKTYWSFDIGMRKPDLDPYLFVIRQNKSFDPAETLFIDDSIQNIEVRKVGGLHALLLNEETEINELFNDNKLKINSV
ncbi:MAG: HAD family phosphatase [Bacteroidales bacterium]